MDSIGAMYSRVSAIVFKDWNNCGKVMGLAPYGRTLPDLSEEERYFIHGHLYDGSIDMEIGRTNGLENLEKSIADCDDTREGRKLRSHFEHIAHHIQHDLEQVAIDFISRLMFETGECNLVLAGGVALNSTMNGILSSLPSIKGFFVPPFPGDEGIAIGCAFFWSFLHFEIVWPTDIPMVLNTSFNTAGEPIVESPIDAIKTFLRAEGIDYLIFPGHILSKREEFSISLSCEISSACCGFRSEQIQNAHGECLRTSVTVFGRTFEVDGKTSDFHFEEQSVELMDGLQLEVLEIVHQLRTCTVSDVLRSINPSLTETGVADFEADGGPSVDDVLLRIEGLFKTQLIYCERDQAEDLESFCLKSKTILEGQLNFVD